MLLMFACVRCETYNQAKIGKLKENYEMRKNMYKIYTYII